jgi:hypothetical protein
MAGPVGMFDSSHALITTLNETRQRRIPLHFTSVLGMFEGIGE